MDQMYSFLIYLIFSHIVSDFVLQSDRCINDKESHKSKSKLLYIHALIVGILAGIISTPFFDLNIAFLIGLAFFLSHLIIDLIKVHFKNTLKSLIVDQLAHFAIIMAIWLLVFPIALSPNVSNFKIWLSSSIVICIIVVLSGYIVLFRPSSIFISKLVESWKLEIDDSESLANAGKHIGYVERLLIFTLVLLHQYTAIGLLVTAKSILRLSERKISEYILFGTLLSFSIAILMGIFVSLFLSHFLPPSAENILISLYNNSK